MIGRSRAEFALSLLEALRGQDSDLGLDDYEHSLQTATRAERDGADPQLVVAALLHDAGKALTPRRHDRVAAEMLVDAVRPEIVWIVGIHQDFAGRELDNGRGRAARYRHILHPGYQLARRFVDDWDLPSRDPEYPTLPVEHFTPLVYEVFAAAGPVPDGWSRSFRAAMGHIPKPVADRIDRVTLAPRRWTKARFRR
jgi:predicted HD phosphohydrolase